MKRLLLVITSVAVAAAVGVTLRTVQLERRTETVRAESRELLARAEAGPGTRIDLQQLRRENADQREVLFAPQFEAAATGAAFSQRAQSLGLSVDRLSADPEAKTVALSVSGSRRGVLGFLSAVASQELPLHLVAEELTLSARENGAAATVLVRARRETEALLQPEVAQALRTAPSGWPVAPLDSVAASLSPPPRPQTVRPQAADPLAAGTTAVSRGAADPAPVPVSTARAEPPAYVGTTQVSGERRYAFRFGEVVRSISAGDSAFDWRLLSVEPERFLFDHKGDSYAITRR